MNHEADEDDDLNSCTLAESVAVQFLVLSGDLGGFFVFFFFFWVDLDCF